MTPVDASIEMRLQVVMLPVADVDAGLGSERFPSGSAK
jgi:hypothetical protein